MIRPSYRQGNVPDLDPGRVNCQTRAARTARARCIIVFLKKLRNPARDRRAGAMRQFCPGQLDSIIESLFVHVYLGTWLSQSKLVRYSEWLIRVKYSDTRVLYMYWTSA